MSTLDYSFPSTILICFTSLREQRPLVLLLPNHRADRRGGRFQILMQKCHPPVPVASEELIDYAIRSGAPLEVLENLQEIEDEGDIYDSIEDIWPDYPTKEDFLFNEDEY